MSTSIDVSFVKKFEAEVHAAYQRQGSKLRNTVRAISNIEGSSTTVQKVGKGVAGKKTKHGKVPVMNLTHSNVELTLEDFYAGDWVDKLDELKIKHDERLIVAQAGANALGRKSDELILTELDTATENVAHGSAGLTIGKIMSAFEKLGSKDVFDDGDRTCIVGLKQWTELLQIDEFSNADYVGADDLPFKGVQAKRWMNTLWMPFSGLPVATNIRTCYWYHKTAVAHGSGLDVTSDITWHGDHAAHFVNNMMSQGAKAVDIDGICKIFCSEA